MFGMFSSKFPQRRHPERSVSHIYRMTQCCGAESKDLGGAHLTHAARIFSTTEAGEQDHLFEMLSSKLPQRRHPERSASPIYRMTQCCGAESKDPGGADLTHAARTFSTTEADEQGF